MVPPGVVGRVRQGHRAGCGGRVQHRSFPRTPPCGPRARGGCRPRRHRQADGGVRSRRARPGMDPRDARGRRRSPRNPRPRRHRTRSARNGAGQPEGRIVGPGAGSTRRRRPPPGRRGPCRGTGGRGPWGPGRRAPGRACPARRRWRATTRFELRDSLVPARVIERSNVSSLVDPQSGRQLRPRRDPRQVVRQFRDVPQSRNTGLGCGAARVEAEQAIGAE